MSKILQYGPHYEDVVHPSIDYAFEMFGSGCSVNRIRELF